jgi:osmotically inducible protein OsmC
MQKLLCAGLPTSHCISLHPVSHNRQPPGDNPWPFSPPKPPAPPPVVKAKPPVPTARSTCSFPHPARTGPANPEQLFAAGYSACFGGAIGAAANLSKVPLRMADIKVTATVRLHKEESGFFIDASLNAELAGVDQQQAEALVAKAHTIYPYSKATRGNIDVKLLANGKPVESGTK